MKSGGFFYFKKEVFHDEWNRLEYTMREDIVMCMEELELSQKQAKALYKSPCLLSDVYEEFKDREV